MSGRNSRIVRNRDRNEERINWNSKSVKMVAKVVIVLVAIILLIMVCIGIKRKTQKKEKIVYNVYGDTVYEYFLLYSGEKVGVIDKKGNLIVEAQYTEVFLPNPAKDVFICYAEDGKQTILNQKGEVIFSDYEQVKEIEIDNGTGEVEKYVLCYQKDGLYGLIDLEGNQLTEPIYEEISSVKDKPGSLLVKQKEKYGVLDSKGNVIIDVSYDSISADGYCSEKSLYEKTGYMVSEKASDGVNFGYIDYQGNILLEPKYESIERAMNNESNDIYLITMQKGKKGVFKNKKKIIDLNFQEIHYSDLSQVFIVNKNGKYGFYKMNGDTILAPEYTSYSIAGNYIAVEKDDEKKLFDINGNLVNTSSYTKMIETKNPAYFIAEDEDGFYSIISKDVKIDEKYVQVEYAFDHYFIVTDETGKTGVINAVTQEMEIQPIYDFILLIDDAEALQAIDGMQNKVDIYDKNLEKTISMEDGIVETVGNGYSVIYSEIDKKYINREGTVVSNTEVYPEETLYAIEENGKWGFVDRNQQNIIACEYDMVTELNQYGFAGIRKDGKWGVIDETGNILVEPTYELDTYYFPEFIGKYRLIQSETVYCEEILET